MIRIKNLTKLAIFALLFVIPFAHGETLTGILERAPQEAQLLSLQFNSETKSLEVPILIEEDSIFAEVNLNFEKSFSTLAFSTSQVLKQTLPSPAKTKLKFKIEGPWMDLEFLEVGPKGETQKETVRLHFKDYEVVKSKLAGIQPVRFFLKQGTDYRWNSYEETNVATEASRGIFAWLEGEYRFAKEYSQTPWSLVATGELTLKTISSTLSAASSVKFSELTVGGRFHYQESRTQIKSKSGIDWYYFGMSVTDNLYGFNRIRGFRIIEQLSRKFIDRFELFLEPSYAIQMQNIFGHFEGLASHRLELRTGVSIDLLGFQAGCYFRGFDLRVKANSHNIVMKSAGGGLEFRYSF